MVGTLPVDLVVSGFDKIEPGGTDYYMNRVGKIGICVECGYLDDPSSTEIAKQSILAFLKARGHTSGTPITSPQSYIRMSELYLTKTENFALEKPFEDFEEIAAGQLIGMDGGEDVRALKDCVILFARNMSKAGEEAFLLGEYEKGPTR
jgi:predicted deacylase